METLLHLFLLVLVGLRHRVFSTLCWFGKDVFLGLDLSIGRVGGVWGCVVHHFWVLGVQELTGGC